MNEKLKALLSSRKFWASVLGLAILIIKAFRPDFPITEDQMTSIVVVIVAYIFGTAIEDHATITAAGSNNQ
jgi:uncharacterized membrane protein YdjX (TVP38/TMEM64 family)